MHFMLSFAFCFQNRLSWRYNVSSISFNLQTDALNFFFFVSSDIRAENLWKTSRFSPGLPYWRIYRQSVDKLDKLKLEVCQILKAFGYKYLVCRFGEFLATFWKHLAPNFFSLAKCTTCICTNLLTSTYVDLLFLSLRMVWKFVTSNESVKVLKVEA